MTQQEFDNYKLQLYWYSSQKAERLAKDKALGKSGLENKMVELNLLNAFISIINEYTLQDYDEENEEDENINFFTRAQMEDIITHINKICGTQYNLNLKLEV